MNLEQRSFGLKKKISRRARQRTFTRTEKQELGPSNIQRGEIDKCLENEEISIFAYEKSAVRCFAVKVFRSLYLPRCHDLEAKARAGYEVDLKNLCLLTKM